MCMFIVIVCFSFATIRLHTIQIWVIVHSKVILFPSIQMGGTLHCVCAFHLDPFKTLIYSPLSTFFLGNWIEMGNLKILGLVLSFVLSLLFSSFVFERRFRIQDSWGLIPISSHICLFKMFSHVFFANNKLIIMFSTHNVNTPKSQQRRACFPFFH